MGAILFPWAKLSNRREYLAGHRSLVRQPSADGIQKHCSEERPAMRYHSKSLSILRNATALAALLITGSLLIGCGTDSGHAAGAIAPSPNTLSPTHETSADANTPKPAATTATLEINIDNFTFSPQTLTVPVGATITWINRDDVPHTVADTGKRFKSAALDTDDKFSFTFTTPGEFPYFCGIHTHMTGKIIVK
jgi:plastocyanin